MSDRVIACLLQTSILSLVLAKYLYSPRAVPIVALIIRDGTFAFITILGALSASPNSPAQLNIQWRAALEISLVVCFVTGKDSSGFVQMYVSHLIKLNTLTNLPTVV